VQLSGYPNDENINSLAFNGEKIFGVTQSSRDLITIDPVTGVITTIGPTNSPDDAVDAIAFRCPLAIPAPAMHGVALQFLWLGLLVLGSLRMLSPARRQRGVP
jgi:hypothetical protein